MDEKLIQLMPWRDILLGLSDQGRLYHIRFGREDLTGSPTYDLKALEAHGPRPGAGDEPA